MKRIYPDQLAHQVQETLQTCYVLAGNEPLILRECQDVLVHSARQKGYAQPYSLTLDAQTPWQELFVNFSSLDLFATRQITLLILPENGPNKVMAEQLQALCALLNENILLILRLPRLTKALESSAWLQTVTAHGALVPCVAPDKARLPDWVRKRASTMALQLDNQAVALLCYHYEGNLSALAQALEQLSLRWPASKLTLQHVTQAINDAARFTPFQWVDALLAGKSKRALKILHTLRQRGEEITILLRTLQRDLMILVALNRCRPPQTARQLFDKHLIWQNRRPLLLQAQARLQHAALHQALTLLKQSEISLKRDHADDIWIQLEILTMLICMETPYPVAYHV